MSNVANNVVVMEYSLDTSKTFKEVRHFDLISGPTVFSNKINLSRNRGFSNAKYAYSLKKRLENKWSPQLTGLFTTSHPDVFYGDTDKQSNLVIAVFDDGGNRVTLHYFYDFYPTSVGDYVVNYVQSI